MTIAEQKPVDLEQRVDALLASPSPTVRQHLDCLNHPGLRGAVSPQHRLALLKQTLHQAVELEFATIPIYLAALWSIKNNLHPVAKSIRNVVQEEMLHLSLPATCSPPLAADPDSMTRVNGACVSQLAFRVGCTPIHFTAVRVDRRRPRRLPGNRTAAR